MKFISGALAHLMATPQFQPQSTAEQANLCMEERIGSARQATYEGRVDGAGNWDDWREHHYRYLKEEVHRRYPLSAAFAASEPSLRPVVEANQFLLRVERIDGMLHRYSDGNGTTVDADQINHWIAATTSAAETSGRTRKSLADLGRLMSGATSSPETAALEGLTEFFNQDRRDGRPSFVAFDAEFPSLADQPDWARQACERCGLAHHFTDGPVVLALFRYRVQEVLDGRSSAEAGTTVFAVPTVIDQPFYNVFFPAPNGTPWGQAVGLAPEDDCRHLVAELIHMRIEYKATHWVAVDTLVSASISESEIGRLREEHQDCIRRKAGNADYGKNC